MRVSAPVVAVIELGTTANAAADYCLVYNDYASLGSSGSCAVPSQGTGDNGNVRGYLYQDSVNSSLSHSALYGYDALNRLTTAAATGSSTYNFTFQYDRWGNMTCMINGQTNGPCPEYSFNSANNRITNTGYTYDAAGDLTSDGTNTYQYDAEGREISVNGSSNWAATYNAFGQVIQRYLASQGETDSFVWDPLGRLSANWTQNRGWWWDEFVWANGALVSDNRQFENTVWFLHADRIASTKGVTTSVGQLMWDNVYYPWGQDWTYAGSNWGFFAGMGLGWSAIGQIETPHRDYIQGQGRWLTPDRLGGDITNPQSLNRYAYALNNPTTLTDPLGLDPISCTWNPMTSTLNCPGPPAVSPNSGSCDPSDIQCLECTQMQVCVQPAPSGCNAYTGVGCGPGENGGGVAVAPKPTPKPVPPSSWASTFAKSFVTNFPQTTWNSITNSNGCINQFFWNTLSNLNPLSPGPSGITEPAANFISAVKFNSALAYAASQPNYLGGTGLLYPFKSSVFNSTLKAGQDVLEAVPVIQLDLALGQALHTEAQSAKAGECQ